MFYCFVLHIVLHCCDTTIRGEIIIIKKSVMNHPVGPTLLKCNDLYCVRQNQVEWVSGDITTCQCIFIYQVFSGFCSLALVFIVLSSLRWWY